MIPLEGGFLHIDMSWYICSPKFSPQQRCNWGPRLWPHLRAVVFFCPKSRNDFWIGIYQPAIIVLQTMLGMISTNLNISHCLLYNKISKKCHLTSSCFSYETSRPAYFMVPDLRQRRLENVNFGSASGKPSQQNKMMRNMTIP